MSYHRDKEVNQAMLRLMDALCTWERETGRRSKLVFVPDAEDEEIVFVMDGKPFPVSPVVLCSQLDIMKSRIMPSSGGTR